MTVALDLDNTLISSTSILLHRRSQCDLEVRDNGSRKCIKKRPHLDEFLDALALFAEAVLFSPAPYAARSSRDLLPRSDDELLKLLPELQSLAQLDDVRPAVRTYQQPPAQVVRGQGLKRTWRMAIEDKYLRKLFSC
ncbi:hypothetical protein SELMODRAFT_406688 [Selaginella moellendorffii]|uniref:Mitochondrial import inner membrane translocase subunit TIM50 n=1 Tax=Selaginella moellendorffii TaxID=88036 RepID=D8R151_SELML|nr:hypothetical protein SELMODRAFT_406688 [Selaginella moellendorffii]